MSFAHYRQIWHTVQQIPAGKVASYGQIADLAGLPGRARLVGKALQHYQGDVALPWYRVLRSDRSLAFAAGTAQAIEQRQRLLAEGVTFERHKVCADCIWQPDLMTLLFQLQF
jgi:methylated-DNA-protein-cysteine methyltransferase-like protein